MTTGQKINTSLIVVVLCSALFAFFTFASTKWISAMEGELEKSRVREIRISALELKMSSVELSLEKIDSKLDRVLNALIEDRRGRE